MRALFVRLSHAPAKTRAQFFFSSSSFSLSLSFSFFLSNPPLVYEARQCCTQQYHKVLQFRKRPAAHAVVGERNSYPVIKLSRCKYIGIIIFFDMFARKFFKFSANSIDNSLSIDVEDTVTCFCRSAVLDFKM